MLSLIFGPGRVDQSGPTSRVRPNSREDQYLSQQMPRTPQWYIKCKRHYPSKFSPRSSNTKLQSGIRPTTKLPSPQGHVNSGSSLPSSNCPPFQICGKTSHQALDCFHMMDYSYKGRHPPTQLATMVAHTNTTIDKQQWFSDSVANAHITNELENLTIQQTF
jgi:hypothetical protein